MEYEKAIDYIHSTQKFGSKLGLENMRKLLYLMGDPHKELEFIHIAGTNGKGSTAAFLSFALIENGLRVGTYTSPYIMVFNERIKFNFNDIENEQLGEITEYVKDKVEALVAGGQNHPTEFEIITCVAFEYFKRKKCDIIVLETGLGGRLDATNIIDPPICSVITKIGYDHKEYLGDTIEQITFEKAGIIKSGSKLYTIKQEPSVLEIFEKACFDMNSEMKVVVPEYEPISKTIDSQIYRYKGQEIEIKLLGEHQIRNSILAYEILVDLGISIDIIINGLLKTKWVGRFEVLRKDPIFIIDGAHNADAVKALKKTIKEYFGDRKIIFIFSVLKDKDYPEMIKEIKECAKVFIIFEIECKRALDLESIEKEIKKHFKNVLKSDKIITAVSTSLSIATKDDVIIAFGSLSYIGEVKKLIKAMEG